MRGGGSCVCVAFALRDAAGEGVLHGLCVEKVAILPKNDVNKRGGEQRSVDSNDNGIITVGLFDFLLKPDLP